MNLIQRDYCVFTGNKDLEPLHTFSKFPVFMGCVKQAAEEDITVDMSWMISRSTGSIQLNPLLPLDLVYTSEHGSGSIGKLWEEHHRNFAQFVLSIQPGARILEIGGGHCRLAKECLQINPHLDWTIIEPNPQTENIPSGVKFIKGFFDETFNSGHKFSAIIHSHLLEHVYYPQQFLKQINELLCDGGIHCFSIPNMHAQLESGYTNCLNFEHTLFLNEALLDYLLLKSRFKLLKKSYFSEHSIFYACVKADTSQRRLVAPSCYESNKSIFSEYISTHKLLVSSLNERLKTVNSPVYLFGGHVFSQYLMAFGLQSDKIISIIDNDPNKQQKRLYGSRLLVNSPGILKGKGKAVVILRAGIFNNEIKKNIIEDINPDIVFWE